MHTGEKGHQCTYCGRCFARARYLQMHILTHTGDRPHKCPTCDMSFARRNTLARHKASVHNKIKPFQCEVCFAGFNRRYLYLRHIKKHSNVEDVINDQKIEINEVISVNTDAGKLDMN